MKNLFTLSLLLMFNVSFAQNLNTFIEHSVDENFAGISTICVANIDNDSLMDLVCGSEATGPSSPSIGLWWMKNNGNSTWTKYPIDASFNNVMSVEIIDINKDGKSDVLASAWTSNEIAYWINNGETIPTWTKKTIKSNFTFAHDAHVFDLNGDGLLDIVGLSANLGQVIIWKQQADSSFTEQIVDNTFTGARALAIGDYNNDGYVDISAVSATKKQLVVYYADSSTVTNWSKTILNSNLNGAHEVINFDLEGDGDIDLLTSSYTSNTIDIWKNNGTNPTVWTKINIGTHIGVNRALPCDFDNDGDIDFVATGKFPTSKLSVWYNQGNDTFVEVVINNQLQAFWAVTIFDFDNDGDMDFFAGASVSGVIRWWENAEPNKINQIDNQNEDIQVFPNPNNGNFQLIIKNVKNENYSIQIIDLMGKLVTKEFEIVTNDDKTECKTNNLPKGLYFVLIKSGNEILTKKIVIK